MTQKYNLLCFPKNILYKKSILFTIVISSAIIGCNNSTEDYVFTLYSSYQGNRLHVATFDSAPISWDDKNADQLFNKMFAEDNFNNCKKIAEFFEKDWKSTVKNSDIKFWCEKGKFRK